ncbi:RNA-binding region-containing protein 3 [Podila epicladia]|nr:RNA-binding region-containing protein 3 [Podila epicladia]
MDTVPPASLVQIPKARLKYAYPPATKPIVNNIATKLLEDPRFYINVLHLMNKMDLPPPFTVKSLATEQPTMVTASMKTIILPSGPHVAPIARPIVEATVMTLVGDHEDRQPSQGFSQQGQKRKQTDDLLASDESEVESEPDEEQERKALVTKMMQEGVLSPDAKCHAHVGALKDPPPKPVADGTTQRTLDLDDAKETARMSDNAPPADDSHETTMDVDQETACPTAMSNCISSELTVPSKDSEAFITSGEKEESHGLSKNVEAVSDQAPKEASENIHILNLDFKKTSRSDLASIFARYFEPKEAILEPNVFKYFTKGKLRNQAFIRMPSTVKATLAIDQIHGCILHDRRIVVQYGLQRASDKQAT